MAVADFTEQAADYARARPGYPVEMVEKLLALAGVRPGDAVADLGAGTGLFTRTLCRRGLRVTAVEPNEAMRRRAPTLSGVTWRDGTFEETSLPDASQRWVVAAQAFHWADPQRALPEVHRILTPGGAFTLLWQSPQASGNPVLTWTHECQMRHVPEYRPLPAPDWPAVLQSTGHFSGPVPLETHHTIATKAEDYLAGLRSGHHLAQVAGPERLQAFLSEVAEHLSRERIGSISILWCCRSCTVWRAGDTRG